MTTKHLVKPRYTNGTGPATVLKADPSNHTGVREALDLLEGMQGPKTFLGLPARREHYFDEEGNAYERVIVDILCPVADAPEEQRQAARELFDRVRPKE